MLEYAQREYLKKQNWEELGRVKKLVIPLEIFSQEFRTWRKGFEPDDVGHFSFSQRLLLKLCDVY